VTCYCGRLLHGKVHWWSGSKWCYPDEPETLDVAKPDTDD